MPKSLLRWVGGKARYAKFIAERLPDVSSIGRYYEPFVGGASVFLEYAPKRAYLADSNQQLIELYRAIRERPDLVSRYLAEHVRQDSELFYYEVRNAYNNSKANSRQAARFLYLNKACFNGVFRVNRAGHFNVPYGFRDKLSVPSPVEIREVARLMWNAQLRVADYKELVNKAGEGDVVFLDPPYPPLNGTSFFTHYTKDRFSVDDQRQVAETAAELVRRGCFVVVTNADTPEIRELYAGWNMEELTRTRWVRSGNHKHKVRELILIKYDLECWGNVSCSGEYQADPS